MTNNKKLNVAEIVSNAISAVEQKVYGPLEGKIRELTGDDLDLIQGAAVKQPQQPK